MGKIWNPRGNKAYVPDALSMAYWLLHPVLKHLSSFLTSQERLKRDRGIQVFTNRHYVREIFDMTVEDWHGDYEAVRKFARAVASGIYYARMMKEDDPNQRQKAWYDEVTMLRSAPTAKAFIERAMILIEQGHRERPQVGTIRWDQAFDPSTLRLSLGESRALFEDFRNLFRMYLVQESTRPADNGPERLADASEDELQAVSATTDGDEKEEGQ